ncbi:D-arabinono-1,4-lactone oxidase [Lysinibacillus louembei]|uniref:D-arabinono-1,4-lactone oxidase n=1 Tax=Lysinibacillus louembei TaxID=1470088 RepID=A0ABZ0RU21_9BACI|nr:D-arabinono-1,4-lactone oxidase [Lysinibacillus louembei]WPK11005.1 D-arabinono-1,4-lactone oxidase [Lysinibacillus louembei]
MFSINNWQQGEKWTNWSQQITSYPSTYYAPISIEEIQQVILNMKKNQTLRVTGAAHSFSPVAMPEETALTMHHLRGLLAVDQENLTATFYAGTYLHEIGPLLAAHNLALINMGDIQAQTLAGVIATGTHGTGVTLGSFSSMVTKWSFINGLGEYIEHEKGADTLSEALHVSVGLLGILVTVTIKVMPLYSLHYISEKVNLMDALQSFQQTIHTHRHVEWFYFPGSDLIQVKKMDAVAPVEQNKWERRLNEANLQLVENGLFYVISELCKWQPKASASVSKLSAKLVSEGQRTDLSYRMFPSPRSVKFVETEYAIPLQQFEACMEEVHAVLKQGLFDVHFPIECRTTKGEEGMLSPTQGEESAFLAFHMYKGMNETPYFEWVRTLMKKYNGRPHWGKVNDYHADNIRQYYPKFDQFAAIREEHDPNNLFVTTYFRRIFQ